MKEINADASMFQTTAQVQIDELRVDVDSLGGG